MENALAALSDELAGAVARAGGAVVTVNARPRMASSGVLWRPGVIVTASTRHPSPRSCSSSAPTPVPSTISVQSP